MALVGSTGSTGTTKRPVLKMKKKAVKALVQKQVPLKKLTARGASKIMGGPKLRAKKLLTKGS